MKLTQSAPAIVLCSLLGAQSGGNVIKHYDGTAEATSRGDGTNFEQITVLQRYPWNQCCGRTKLCCVEATLHDNNPASTEYLYLEVRSSDMTDPLFPLGKPNMTGGGLLFTMPLQLSFSTPVQHFSFTLPGCVDLPAGPGPGADFYVGFRFNVAPMWPADGVSCHFSGKAFSLPGEQYIPTPLGMYAASPTPGLGWSCDSTGVPKINVGDLAWAIGAGLFEDVCQPFTHSPSGRFSGTGGTGLDFNYGYAGIWPDIAGETDEIGWRVRTVAPPGSMCCLVIGFNLPGPIEIPSLVDGQLCVTYVTSLVQLTVAEDVCATQSNAVFGSWAAGSGGGTIPIGAQAVTVDFNNVWHLSTACTTVL